MTSTGTSWRPTWRRESCGIDTATLSNRPVAGCLDCSHASNLIIMNRNSARIFCISSR